MMISSMLWVNGTFCTQIACRQCPLSSSWSISAEHVHQSSWQSTLPIKPVESKHDMMPCAEKSLCVIESLPKCGPSERK